MQLSLNTINETLLFLDRVSTELNTSFIHIEDNLSTEFKQILSDEIIKFQNLADEFLD